MKNIIKLLTFIILQFCFITYGHAQTKKDNTLIDAVKQNNTSLAEKLINNGANVNAVDSNLATPLMWAAYTGNLSIFKYLVQKGADYKKKGVIYLDSTKQSYYGNIMGMAAAKNDTLLLAYCLDSLKIPVDDKEYDPETKQTDGWTPLDWAASMGNLAATKILVKYNANINEVYDKDGNTPLLYAAQAGSADIMVYLINLPNINLNAKNKNGWQLIHYICRDYSEPKLIEIIIRKGVDINIQSKTGLTPLMVAAYNGNIQSCFALLELNADVAIADNKQKKARDYAFANRKFATALFLDKYSERYSEKQLLMLLDSIETENRLYNQGDSCNKLHQYRCAVENWNLTLEYSKLIYGKDHPDYIISIINLGTLYEQMGNYDKAMLLLEQSVQINNKMYGKTDTNFAKSLNDLAVLYFRMGYYYKALPLFRQAVQICKEITGINSTLYATFVSNLALLLDNSGNFDEAMSLYQQALEIRKELLGEKHLDYSTSLNNLAGLYVKMGNYNKALSLYQQSIDIIEKVYGEKTQNYATLLTNLAYLYRKMQNYRSALPLLKESLQIRKEIFGEKHPDYANSLDNLGGLYWDMNDYSKAIPLYKKALEIKKELLGEEHPDYVASLQNLATVYESMGSYNKSILLYQQALHIYEKILGTNHPDYVSCLNNLALIYYKDDYFQKADQLIKQDILLLDENLQNGSKFLSQTDMINFINANYFNFEIVNSIALRQKDESLLESGLQSELTFKGIALQNSKDLSFIINQNSNSDLKELVDQFITTRNQLSALYKKNAPSGEIDSALAVFDRQEQQLIQRSPEYQQMVKNRNVQWQQVQQKLKPNEAAIEFVDFQYWDKRWTDTTLYAAFLLLPKGQPQMVALCNKKMLEQRINDTLDKNEIYVKKLYQVKDRGVTVESNQKDTVPGLYRLVWQPLDSLLAGINTIYYAPAGLLNRINLAAINYSGNKVLGDKYVFHLMGSTRDLVNYKSERIDITADTLLLYGGIQFNMDSASLAQQHNKYFSTPTFNDGLAMRSGNSFNWPPIEGSAEELASIEALADSQKIPTHSFTQKQATEESFIYYTHQTKSPAIIHIATHGFFYPDQQRRRLNEEGKDAPYFMSSVNTLDRSGIVFAGANQVTSGKAPIQGIEDGIVTAGDISNTNLQNTKLMVLSACETGLGKIENTEGVFGLQRAIRMAGCKNLLMSLWKVPDEQTARFMNYFYTQLLQEKKTIYESYQYAQKQMRELYSGQPYFWAGFVLME